MVNNTGSFDFAKLKNAFHVLDKDNSGTLEISEIREAFNEMNISQQELDQIFDNIDLNHDGEINYTEFLAVTVDRQRAMTENNMRFAFHHFDVLTEKTYQIIVKIITLLTKKSPFNAGSFHIKYLHISLWYFRHYQDCRILE